MTELWLPKKYAVGRKPVCVVFYRHVKTGRLVMGFPAQYPAPKGFDKVICTTAHDVDVMSAKLHDQERRDDAMTDEQREAVEGPVREYARKELVTSMMTARNNVNREFCRWALKQMDDQEARRKVIRESYMHCEAAEDGK
jgi:hypothetical protein